MILEQFVNATKTVFEERRGSRSDSWSVHSWDGFGFQNLMVWPWFSARRSQGAMLVSWSVTETIISLPSGNFKAEERLCRSWVEALPRTIYGRISHISIFSLFSKSQPFEITTSLTNLSGARIYELGGSEKTGSHKIIRMFPNDIRSSELDVRIRQIMLYTVRSSNQSVCENQILAIQSSTKILTNSTGRES